MFNIKELSRKRKTFRKKASPEMMMIANIYLLREKNPTD
jgi:hypothetical protein